MIIMITICILQCHWYISYLWCQMFIHLSRKAYLVQKVCKIKNNCGCLQHDGLFWSKRRSRGGNCTLTLMRGQNPEYKGSPISKSICDCKWNESPPPLQCSIPTFPIFLNKCMFVCDFSPLTFCETFRYGEQQKQRIRCVICCDCHVWNY